MRRLGHDCTGSCICRFAVTGHVEQDPKCPWKGHSAAINEVAFSPEGKWVVSVSGDYDTTDDRTLRIWDVETGEVSSFEMR